MGGEYLIYLESLSFPGCVTGHISFIYKLWQYVAIFNLKLHVTKSLWPLNSGYGTKLIITSGKSLESQTISESSKYQQIV